MSETVIVANSSETKTVPAMGKFERYLTLWVVLCIIVGIGLGQPCPACSTSSARQLWPK